MLSFQKLKKPYKNAYPFRLAAPSYIYPVDWCTNVELLGPYIDEIELLFLESHSVSCFPSAADIKRLASLAKAYSITYNVHLPSDISLSDSKESNRRQAVEILNRVISLSSELRPSTWTLHLPFDGKNARPEGIEEWRVRNRDGLAQLLEMSRISPMSLSIETLFYPFEWIIDVVRSLDLSVCLDTGHLMIKGVDVVKFYARYADIISIMHLHGVCHRGECGHGAYQRGGSDPDGTQLTDHESLDRLSAKREEDILTLLRRYKGTVSIEVFSFDKLYSSLEWLSHRWAPGIK